MIIFVNSDLNPAYFILIIFRSGTYLVTGKYIRYIMMTYIDYVDLIHEAHL